MCINKWLLRLLFVSTITSCHGNAPACLEAFKRPLSNYVVAFRRVWLALWDHEPENLVLWVGLWPITVFRDRPGPYSP